MGQVLHSSARTTAAVRAAIQRGQESLQILANRFNLNPKTLAKWRKRTTVVDAQMGPQPASTLLTIQEEAIVVAFRQHTLLPLDDCLYALQATIPHLSRSDLHQKKKFKRSTAREIGYLQIDFAEVHTEQGKCFLFVAIDRTSKVAFAELHPRATKVVAAEFLRRVLSSLPYKVHKVLMTTVHNLATCLISRMRVGLFLTVFARNMALNIALPNLPIPGRMVSRAAGRWSV